MEGVMLQHGARGAVRLGKEVCVHIPSFPSLLEKGGTWHEGKKGEMNEKTVGWEQRLWRKTTGMVHPSFTFTGHQCCLDADKSATPYVHKVPA